MRLILKSLVTKVIINLKNDTLEIQTALVEMEDKEKSIIGSNQWLGAFEVNLCVQHYMGVS